MTDLAARVCEIASDVFEVETGTITPASTPDDVESWDSLAMLNLMVALEDEFDVQLSPDAVAEASSIGALVSMVGALLDA